MEGKRLFMSLVVKLITTQVKFYLRVTTSSKEVCVVDPLNRMQGHLLQQLGVKLTYTVLNLNP